MEGDPRDTSTEYVTVCESDEEKVLLNVRSIENVEVGVHDSEIVKVAEVDRVVVTVRV